MNWGENKHNPSEREQVQKAGLRSAGKAQNSVHCSPFTVHCSVNSVTYDLDKSDKMNELSIG